MCLQARRARLDETLLQIGQLTLYCTFILYAQSYIVFRLKDDGASLTNLDANYAIQLIDSAKGLKNKWSTALSQHKPGDMPIPGLLAEIGMVFNGIRECTTREIGNLLYLFCYSPCILWYPLCLSEFYYEDLFQNQGTYVHTIIYSICCKTEHNSING